MINILYSIYHRRCFFSSIHDLSLVRCWVQSNCPLKSIASKYLEIIMLYKKMITLKGRCNNNCCSRLLLLPSSVPVGSSKSNFNWNLYYNHCNVTHPAINPPNHPPREIILPQLQLQLSWAGIALVSLSTPTHPATHPSNQPQEK